MGPELSHWSGKCNLSKGAVLTDEGADKLTQGMSKDGGPAVVLVKPQMGENIGAAARAMFNFSLTELLLVAPRDGWPNAKAIAMAAGAAKVAEAAQVFDSTKSALSGFQYVIACTARDRDMAKPAFTPERAAQELRARHEAGQKVALVFGAEASGLENEDISLMDAILTIPANPEFSSLNLGQAVLLCGYEWMKAADQTAPESRGRGEATPASREALVQLFEHLEEALIHSNFLMLEEKRPAMVQNIRAMLMRAELTEQEVRTWRGMIKSLQRATPRKG